MNAFVAVVFLACAASGQILAGPWGLNRAWNGGAIAYGAPIAANTWSSPAVAYNAPAVLPAPMVTSSQYHAQDELGQASFGYSYPGAAASNMRDALGNQVGSYAYINPAGKEVKVSYVADSLGFRVLSNDLPVAPIAAPVAVLPAPLPVSDTVEVIEARNAHAAAHAAAKAGIVTLPAPVMIGELPKPVDDTPEVKAAKAEHMAAKALAASRSKRQIPLGLPLGLPLASNWMTGRALPSLAVASPLAYSGQVISTPALRDAVLTNIVHTPGHAMSYRVD